MNFTNQLRQSIFIFTFLLFCSFVGAEESGQIININQGFKIAFTDLGNRALKPNDIVKVFISRDEFLYMKVLESSPILSKLGPVQEDAFKTILQDLPRISVGNVVVRLSDASYDEVTEVETRIEPIIESKIMSPSTPTTNHETAVLKQELAEANNEIKNLKEANATLESRISELVAKIQAKEAEALTPQKNQKSNDENLLKLKAQLEKMQQLLNQN